jgi:uncharacterized membrane protein
MAWRGSTTTGDRIIACLPYILPIADSLIFASAFLTLLPIAAPVLLPLITVGLVYMTAISFLGPFGSLIIFFALYLFVVRNTNIKHFIRFHTMQAMLIGIGISLINLFFNLVNLPVVRLLSPANPLGIVAPLLFAGLFIVIAACYLYSIFGAIQGKYAEIPYISEAAYAQTQV